MQGCQREGTSYIMIWRLEHLGDWAKRRTGSKCFNEPLENGVVRLVANRHCHTSRRSILWILEDVSDSNNNVHTDQRAVGGICLTARLAQNYKRIITAGLMTRSPGQEMFNLACSVFTLHSSFEPNKWQFACTRVYRSVVKWAFGNQFVVREY
ncbi:hypothetical protein Bbelb_175460 [Branchiostoma belcheri]|nr:hypothetical protein Bbelb_175460 [Branchiostoma belcheri]